MYTITLRLVTQRSMRPLETTSRVPMIDDCMWDSFQSSANKRRSLTESVELGADFSR